MRAIEIDRYGSPAVMQWRIAAKPGIQRDEVLVRVMAAAVNPKDTFIRKGRYRLFTRRKFPLRLGNDFAGVVVEAGAAVQDLKSGDRVFGMLNGWRGGAYAEYVAAKANEVARFPDGLSFEEAAALPLAGQTALQALRDLARLKAGDRVCINGGSGGVGTLAIQIARAFGANVTALCSAPNVQLCKELGASTVLDYAQMNIETTENEFEIFFDVFGNKSFARVRHLLTPAGIYVTTVPKLKNFWRHFATLLTRKRARVVVVKSRREDLEALSRLLQQRLIRPMIDKVYAIDEAPLAHRHVETKHSRGKVILRIDHETN